jgi:hypothetical protein
MPETTTGTTVVGGFGHVTLRRSPTPNVYVPRRFRLGTLDDVPTGAAIVGTPQANGLVAVDIQSTRYVEPTPETWTTWVAEAARRHTAGEDELLPGEESQTRLVPEYQLVEVGRCIQRHVLIEDPALGATLQRWIEAGRVDYAIDGFRSAESD